MAQPVVLIGTGTSVGKTYVGERLLRGLAARGLRASGYKPVESGVPDPEAPSTDHARVMAASSFHVKPAMTRFTFPKPVSAHLAAREARRPLDLERIRSEISRGQKSVDVLVVELPGGAFSPLTDTMTAADFARMLDARVLLVGSDRLGVLHDVVATCRACASLGLVLEGVLLSAPAVPDDSTGTNAPELAALTRVPVLGVLPRLDAASPIVPGDPIRAVAERFSTAPK